MAQRNQDQRPADRRGWRSLAALSLAASAALMPPVLAAPLGQFQSFDQGPAGYAGNVLISGPDGRQWFTDNQNNAIRSISADGTVRSYPIPTDPSQASGAGLFALAAGPDGAIWFTGFYSNV
ncbi:MAG: Vgb, partial [Cyanobacteriota bacterium]